MPERMSMHDIWNPWHGCRKRSEGCANCYMYYLDSLRGAQGDEIHRNKADSAKPLRRSRDGAFLIRSGETLRVCMTSDFFLEKADPWRDEAWAVMYARPEVIFYLLVKRPERVASCLPADWGTGWENIFFNVTCENQTRADGRIPLLLDLPLRHKGIMCAPLLGEISLRHYLDDGQIERVVCGGENYDGARPCDFAWVLRLRQECIEQDVTFCFTETGSDFVKDGIHYHFSDKHHQSVEAGRSHTFYQGRQHPYHLRYPIGLPVPEEELYHPISQNAARPVVCVPSAMAAATVEPADSGCTACVRKSLGADAARRQIVQPLPSWKRQMSL